MAVVSGPANAAVRWTRAKATSHNIYLLRERSSRSRAMRRPNSSSGAMARALSSSTAIAKFVASGCFRSEWFKEFEMQRPAGMDIVRRAYELESKRQSLTAEIRNFIIRQNRNCKKQTNKPSQNSRVNAASAASVRLRNLGRQRFLRAIRNLIHLLGLQLHPPPNSSKASHVSSRQEAHVHRPRRRTGPAFWKYAS